MSPSLKRDSAEPKPLLMLEAIHHGYGKRMAVDGVSLKVRSGELLCLLGPSGCGKSTLLRLIAGLEPLQSGNIRMDDHIIAGEGIDLPPEQRAIGMLFQDNALFPHLNALQNVAFGLRGMRRADQEKKALALLRDLELEEFAQSYPYQLSGGQQQRVALARALAPEPRLLLLDEPFTALDSNLRAQIRQQTAQLLRRNAVTAILVTHDPEEAMLLADRIAVMRQGWIEQIGTAQELYDHPQNAFVAGIFGDINRLKGVIQDGKAITLLGAVPAKQYAEGAKVQVLFRPTALQLCEMGEGLPPVEVMAAHAVGEDSVIELAFPDQPPSTPRLRVRMTGRFLPARGQKLFLISRSDKGFVFPE